MTSTTPVQVGTLHGTQTELVVPPGTEADVEDRWWIFAELVSTGEYYALDETTTREESIAYWTGNEGPWFVADSDDSDDRVGSHVANAAFVVDAAARGLHVGHHLVVRALRAAAEVEYRSMQFNPVVATSHAAIRLYQAMGLSVVGPEPEAFQRTDGSLVDAPLFHRLIDPARQQEVPS